MRLNEITDRPGAKKKRVRIGRGIGSGVGKTGGRGVKGQSSRTGVALGGFEGGQMPLHRRLPKRGFTMPGRLSFAIVNTGDLQRAIDSGRLDPAKPVNAAALMEAGLMRRKRDGLRLLGNGELKAKLAITVDHASASAKAAVEKAGGGVTLIERKVLAVDEAKAKKSAAKKSASGKAKPKAAGEE